MRHLVVILTFLALLLQGVFPAQPVNASICLVKKIESATAVTSHASCCDRARDTDTHDGKDESQSPCRSCLVCNLSASANLIAVTIAVPAIDVDEGKHEVVAHATYPIAVFTIPAVPPPRA